MPSHVDSVNSCVIGITDEPLNVSRFDLMLGVNAIPQISLEILPTYRNTSGKNAISVSSPSYKDVVSLYEELKAKAEARHQDNPTTGYFSISAEGQEGDPLGCWFSTFAGDWVLTDVSLSSVMPGEAPTLTIVMKHPAEVLDRVGDIYEKPANFNFIKLLFQEVSGIDEMVPLLDAVYSMFAGGKINYLEIPGSFAGKVKNFRKKIMSHLPGKYLYSDHGLFLSPQASSILGGKLKKILRTSLGVSFSMTECSIWQTLIQKVCPTCLMSVVPQNRLDDRLHLIPCSPWREPQFTISGKEVLSIGLSHQDPHPIMGVMSPNITEDAPVSTDAKSHRPANSQRGKVKYTDLSHYYIPENATIGELLHTGGNPVLTGMMDLNLSKILPNTDTGISSMTGTMFVSAYRKMNEAYSKALYECTYRRNCTGSVITTLSSMSSIILPGNVISVEIGDSVEKAITGYVNSVIHSGSSKGECSSAFNISYVRPAEGSVGDVIESGTQNCCFTPLTVVE